MAENLTQKHKNDLLKKIKEIKEFISGKDSSGKFNAYLSELENEVNKKDYGLKFEDHKEDFDEKLEKSLPVLTEVDKYLIPGGKVNFLIEEDNLASLNLLNRTHKGKIDVIYIDPPYNTGNKTRDGGFKYNDSFVSAEDGYRHSKWLSFMKKRLVLAKQLMNKGSVMFISINDVEMANLKLLCSDIFGENNVDTLIWNTEADGKSGSLKQTKRFRNIHEFIIICYIDKYSVEFNKINEPLPNVKFQTTNLAKNNQNKRGDSTRIFKITSPSGVVWEDEWKYDKEKIDELLKKGLIYFGRNGENKPREILPTDENRMVYLTSIINQGSTTQGTKDLSNIIGENDFSYPKPLKLIKTLIKLHKGEKPTVLDFFAGSGTTGQAVFELNKENPNIERELILCTNNENGICEDITFERLKEVIKSQKLEEGLKYYKVDYIETENKVYYEYSAELLKHVRELVELENAIDFKNNDRIGIAITEEDLEEILNQNECKFKKIYIGADIMLSSEQENEMVKRNIDLIRIPNYYYAE